MTRIHRYIGPMLLGFWASLIFASPPSASRPGEEGEAAYNVAINKRVEDIIHALNIPDEAAVSRLRAILLNRYHELRDWHAKNDPILKNAGWKADEEWDTSRLSAGHNAASVEAVLKDAQVRHNDFLAALWADLPTQQIDVVKDKLTYNKMQVTYNAYLEIVPNLTDDEKAKLRELLWFAREEAMDGGSSEEKSAIFKRYKNRCKAYLISQGHDVNQDYKNWGEAQKQKKAAATSRPMGD